MIKTWSPIKVEVQIEPVTIPCHGGLNAEEWLESQKLTPEPALDYYGSLD